MSATIKNTPNPHPNPHPSFSINAPSNPDTPNTPAVRLPTLGLSSFPSHQPPTSVDEYVRAMHIAIGDHTPYISDNLQEAAKALGMAPPQAFSYSSMAFMPDPAHHGLVQWPGLNPDSLRKLSRDNVGVQMIIRSRVTDLARYSGVSTHPWKPGWRITLRDAAATPTTQDRADMKEATDFIYHCCLDNDGSARARDARLLSPFELFLRGFADDAHTFDAWAIWTDTDSKGRIRAFANLPAGSIRLAVPTRGIAGNRNHFAALVDETGTPVKHFTRDELIWRVRNVRNDPAAMGYGWPECYDADTQVLTSTGWKLFPDVNMASDKVATMDIDTRRFEWQTPTHRVRRSYVGKMYRIKSRSLDLLVTPNHRMLVRVRDQAKHLTVMTAEELFKRKKAIGNNIKLPITSQWKGVEIGNREFNGTDSMGRPYLHPVDMQGDDYCAFMGMYLSEGYVPNNVNRKNVYICQRETSKGHALFKEVLTRINGGVAPYYGRGEFVLRAKAVADYVKQFGKDCYTKHVPPDILNATPRQIQIFLDYYLLGDGRSQSDSRVVRKSTRRGRLNGVYRSITTSSRIMADQLQELIQKAGYAASIGVQEPRVRRMQHTSLPRADGTSLAYDYTSISSTHYEVCYKGSEAHGFDIAEETYAGDVGCVTVPNGTLYVRRNNKAVWCGNCEIALTLLTAFQSAIELNQTTFTKSSIPNGMLLLKGNYFSQDQIDALMREWTNMKRGISKVWGMPVMSIPEDSEVEVLSFNDLKGTDVRYRDHMNMMMGCLAVVYQFPIRRFGMFASGHTRDNQPVQDAAIDIQGADDPGLPALLMHVEETINQYILQPNWPNLQLEFQNRDPKQDARAYEARKLARTWGEARAEADMQPLTSLVPPELKEFAEILQLAPEDPAKAGIFQSMAAAVLQSAYGIGEAASPASASGDTATPGARMVPKRDPAASQGHGHLAGVRRNSRAEKE